jgi:hypothetical protein
VPAAPDDWRRMGQEPHLMGVDLEQRPYTPPAQERLKAWRPSSLGVVTEGFADAPPSEGLLAQSGAVDDWEEVEPPHAWDHDHCKFCWVTFEEQAKVAARPPLDRRVVTEGYLVVGSRHWICEECFEDFKDEFRWSVTKASESSSD